MKIFVPNSTQIPNVIFDYWMGILSPAEFKVLLCICRKTFGWQKKADTISRKQISKLTGMAEETIRKNLQCLCEHGLLIKHTSKTEWGDDAPNEYEINVYDPEVDETEKHPQGGQDLGNQGASKWSPRGPKFSHTKYTNTKDTNTKDKGEVGPPPNPPIPSRKKIKEIPEEVAPRIWLTPSQKSEATKKYFGNSHLLSKAYEKFSNWKIQKGMTGGKNDYQALVGWVLDAIKSDFPEICGIKNITQVVVDEDKIKKNKRMCEHVEAMLQNRFSTTVYFNASSTSAHLFYKSKQIDKIYDYSIYEPEYLKEILLTDLETCFPGSRDLLVMRRDSSSESINKFISKLSDQFKSKEAREAV